MNTEYISKQISKLPITESDDFFLKYKPTLSEDYAKSLVNKTIYFTWKHTIKDSTSNEVETIKEDISGKVLDYIDNTLRIYTNYVLMLEQDLNDPNDLKDNSFIQDIPLEDITNIAELTNYRFEGWEILPNDYYGKIYEITNMQGSTITAITYDFDGHYLYLAYKQEDNNIAKNRYPISLINAVKLIAE